MKRIALIVTAVVGLIGCDGGGDDDWRPGCSDTNPCAAGSYCAETPDGNVCWPDEVAPVVNAVRVSCGGSLTCRRDGTLRVEVEVTDDVKVAAVEVELGFESPERRVLQKVEGTDAYEASIPLAEIPFPYFERTIAVTVTAKDEAGNEGGDVSPEMPRVTREAWPRRLLSSAGLWSPAVARDGTVVVSAKDGRVYFVKPDGASTSVAVLTSPATALLALNGPVAIGTDAVWVGSEDGRLYHLGLDGSILSSCNARGPTFGAPAISGDTAVTATAGTFVAAASASGACDLTGITGSGQPVLDTAGSIFIPSSGKLRSYSLAEGGVLLERWTDSPPAPTIGNVFVPPAIARDGAVWTTSNMGPVYRTNTSGVTEQVPANPAVSDVSTGPIILSDGSAVLGDNGANSVRRFRANGFSPWATNPVLDGHATIPLALLDESTPSLLVTTDTGYLYLIHSGDGRVVWSRFLTEISSALQPPNIWTEPNASTSTALISGADGYLYGVIVDGKLDTSAPWPKAYHDPQNTSNAGHPLSTSNAGVTP